MRLVLVLVLVGLVGLVACNSRTVSLLDGTVADTELSADAGGPIAAPDAASPYCSTGSDCGPTAYCHIEGACIATGAKMGECKPRPDACDQVADPVCGCDGATYSNACMAHAAGVNVARKGACEGICGKAFYLPACKPTEVCDYQSCGAATGKCVPKPSPKDCLAMSGPVVCGCDNKTYATDCERLLAGVALSHTGACQPMVTVVTDKATYNPSDPALITLTNGTTKSVFLPGCSVYSWERKEGGAWVNKGPTVICGWEGNAKEVTSGGTYVETSQNKAGTWRLRLDYGVGCTPGKPLSGAGCAAMLYAYSNVFTILPGQKDCIALQTQYAAAVSAAKSCSAADPVPHCQHLVLESLACNCKTYVETDSQLKSVHQAFKDMGCELISLPVCPPVACPSLKGSTCANDTCIDLTY